MAPFSRFITALPRRYTPLALKDSKKKVVHQTSVVKSRAATTTTEPEAITTTTTPGPKLSIMQKALLFQGLEVGDWDRISASSGRSTLPVGGEKEVVVSNVCAGKGGVKGEGKVITTRLDGITDGGKGTFHRGLRFLCVHC